MGGVSRSVEIARLDEVVIVDVLGKVRFTFF